MGSTLVAVDATCACVMGLEPSRAAYLRTASAFLGNLDEARIAHRGEPISRSESPFEVIDAFTSLRRAR
jgi:hypothetical protein